jgi:predicted CDP-diglyceride synthetase/phosphatidate cytidylyltransferase
MDRFDSVLFTAPVIYYLMRIILLVWFASFYLN